MTSFDLPYQPIRGSLYSQELFEGFDPGVAASFKETKDFKIYKDFVQLGGAYSVDGFATMMRSLHDNSITQALRLFLTGQKCVAIMGGHNLKRDSTGYSNVARLARLLSRSSLLVASGGGPGAMEAAH